MGEREQCCSLHPEWELYHMHVTGPGELSLLVKILNKDVNEEHFLWQALQRAFEPWIPHLPFKILLVNDSTILRCYVNVQLTEDQPTEGEIPSVAQMYGYKGTFITLVTCFSKYSLIYCT